MIFVRHSLVCNLHKFYLPHKYCFRNCNSCVVQTIQMLLCKYESKSEHTEGEIENTVQCHIEFIDYTFTELYTITNDNKLFTGYEQYAIIKINLLSNFRNESDTLTNICPFRTFPHSHVTSSWHTL